MKLNKFFMLMAMGLALFACNDDLNGNGQNGNKAEEGTTYVAFSLDFKGVNSRATEQGTDEEQKITEAYVMLVDGTTITKVVSMTPTAGVDRYDTDKKKFLMTTTAGPHDFYAVVNPETAPVENNDITMYFNEATPLAIDAVATKDKFMMSSQEKKTMTVLDNVTPEQALDGANNLKIPVERVSAKVTMTCSNPILEGTNGKAVGGKLIEESTQFTLKGIASKSYRMKQGTTNEIEDNTYEGASDKVNVSFKQEEGDASIWNNATPAYCLENLHNIYYQRNTTYVSLETVFVPEKVIDANGDIVDNTNFTNATPASFYVATSGDLTGNYILADVLEKMEGNSEVALTKYPDGVTAVQGPYKNGVCHFGPIWVGQEEIGESPTAPIERNTWYNLAITKITLPGQPNPKEPEGGDTPLEPETNVAITLNVMPWNFIDREINLQ